jgi:hypothetical protein
MSRSRREFLTTAASFLPLSGLRLDLFSFQRDMIAEAKRLHDKVLSAFDFGATLPAIPWEKTAAYYFVPDQSDLNVYLAGLQNDISKLPHGRDYEISTDLSIHKGRDRIVFHVRPHFWSRFERRPPKDFIGKMEIYSDRGWRHWSYRHL